MYWKQPITTETLELDLVTRIIFCEIMLHVKNKDMKYPAYFMHGNQNIKYQLKRGEAIFKNSDLLIIGIPRRRIEASIKLLSQPNCTFTCTFTRKSFGFIVSVLNYDELISLDDNVHSDVQSVVHSPVHTNNKIEKNDKIDKSINLESQDDSDPVVVKVTPKKTVNSKLLEDDKFSQTWKYFKEHRKKKNAALTDHAEQLNLNKVEKLSGMDPIKAVEVVEYAIMRGWQTVFPIPKDEKPPDKNSDFSKINVTYV